MLSVVCDCSVVLGEESDFGLLSTRVVDELELATSADEVSVWLRVVDWLCCGGIEVRSGVATEAEGAEDGPGPAAGRVGCTLRAPFGLADDGLAAVDCSAILAFLNSHTFTAGGFGNIATGSGLSSWAVSMASSSRDELGVVIVVLFAVVVSSKSFSAVVALEEGRWPPADDDADDIDSFNVLLSPPADAFVPACSDTVAASRSDEVL